MSASEYYWTQSLIKGFGKMWFLLNAQEATSSGGGAGLLGSFVEERSSGFWPSTSSWPAPFQLTTPRLLHDALTARRVELKIPDGAEIVQEIALSPASQKLTVKKKHAIQAGTGTFPGLPVSLNLGIDYSRMVTIEASFGPSTRMRFIPTEYLARLYKSVDGDWKKIWPELAVEVDDNYYVDQVLLANDFSITFESEEEFNAEFGAKLEALNALPDASGKVTFANVTKKSVTAHVKTTEFYLIALMAHDWDGLG